MKMSYIRQIVISLIASSVLSSTALSQAKETPSQDRFVKLDAMRVHYQNYGEGKEAIVFIHGWSCNLNFWKANIPAFAKQSRVIAIDLPGHGESDKPQITYSMDLFARAVDAVLQDAGVDRATLVGHSMGTPVIRQFYRKYPSKTRGLVIVDGSLRPFSNPEQMKQFMEPLRGPNYKERAGLMINFMLQPVKDNQTKEEIRAAMISAPQHVMVGAMDAMMDDAIWKQDKINAPTLAIMAKQPQSTAEDETFVRELVPGIDYQVWEGVSHFLMMDEPQKFNDAVLAFLKKNKLIRN
ncbi:MAG TPA: alpha/beta hydrolase [Blastocatellia bacterium]|nr:alpha/beta hydrolase [Blastocatellia bacterium]